MSSRRRLLIGVLAFVSVGLPQAAFGVAWPSVASDLARPLGDLGTVSAVYAIGFFSVTSVAGRLMERIGVGPMLSGAGWLAVIALIGYATASSWTVLLVAAGLLGGSGGAFDAGFNAFTALELDARALNFLHAGYGIGATLGPWMMTAMIASGAGWRLGIGVAAVVKLVVAAAIGRTASTWAFTPHDEHLSPGPRVGRTIVVAALVVFFFYTGVELIAGQYAFTFLSEGRGVDVTVAGLAAGGFWLGLTFARIMLGILGERVKPRSMVSMATLGTVATLSLLWWSPTPWAGPVALLLAGFALGPFFPLHIAMTPGRVGRAATPRMVGYQIAAANVGAASLPWLTGRAIDNIGLWTVGPALAITSVGLFVADRVLAGRTARSVTA